MSNRRSFVILALVRKKAETLGKIEEVKEKLSRLEDDSASLDASIRMFDPDFDLSSVKPIRKRKGRKPRPNGASRRMLEVLRTAGVPMTARQIQEQISDLPLDSIRAAISAQAKAGVLERAGRSGRELLWKPAMLGNQATAAKGEVLAFKRRP